MNNPDLEHNAMLAERQRGYRLKRIAAGKCASAGCKNPKPENKPVCRVCRDAMNVRNEARRARLRAARRCMTCTRPLYLDWKRSSCEECLEYARARRKELRNA